MALRPLYMGLHFYLPQGTASLTHVGAVAHARYLVSPKKEELVRSSDPGIYAQSIAERPGSAGLFGPDPEQEPDLSQMVNIIQHHPGPVWRLIVSVTEEDARVLAEHSSDLLLQRSSWEEVCRLVMPQIGAELGLTGLDWAAAMHRKEGHPHIHLLFWESNPRRAAGQVSAGERQQMRRLWIGLIPWYRYRRRSMMPRIGPSPVKQRGILPTRCPTRIRVAGIRFGPQRKKRSRSL